MLVRKDATKSSEGNAGPTTVCERHVRSDGTKKIFIRQTGSATDSKLKKDQQSKRGWTYR